MDAVEGIGDANYIKALEKFTSADWGTMFMRMNVERHSVGLTSSFDQLCYVIDDPGLSYCFYYH